MRRLTLLGLVSLLVTCIALGLTAQSRNGEILDGRELKDLYLISDGSKPEWGDGWTAPIEAATILAWYQMKGYATLLGDWNGDGIVDILDAIELADYFGRSRMRSGSEEGTSDARLVDTLARYVAGRNPDEFEILIYDEGFPGEYEDEFVSTFASDMISGISIALESEPSVEAYTEAILAGLGVIVGIAEDSGLNYYLAGRSFLFEPVGEGLHAMDFAWSQEDLWTPGEQGQILRTIATSRSALHIEFRGDWREVEFMAILAPVDRLSLGAAAACEGAELRVDLMDILCRCDHAREVCLAEAWFLIRNTGDMESPACEVELGTAGWSVPAFLGPLPSGGSAVATIGQPFDAAEAPCPWRAYMNVDSLDAIDECNEGNNSSEGTVCCPEPPVAGCPDLAIALENVMCSCDEPCRESGMLCIVEADLVVTNVGEEDAGGFSSWLFDVPHGIHDGLGVGESATDHGLFGAECATESGEYLVFARVQVDGEDCDEANNWIELLVTCEPTPCVDWAVAVDGSECNCEWVESDTCTEGREMVCSPVLTVTVANVGEEDAEATTVETNSLETWSSSFPVPALASGEAVTSELELDWPGASCVAARFPFDVEVRVPDAGDCDPSDNYASADVICEPLCEGPDLAVWIQAMNCACEPLEEGDEACPGATGQSCQGEIWLGVRNDGAADSGPYDAYYSTGSHTGGAYGNPGLAPGVSETFHFFLPPVAHCDSGDSAIFVVAGAVASDDCDSANDEVEFSIPCSAPEAAGCPDLVGEIVRVVDDCEGGEPIYERRLVGFNPSTKPPAPIYDDVLVGHTPYACELMVTVNVTNEGDAAAPPSQLTVLDHEHEIDASLAIGGLAPGETTTQRIELAYEPEDCSFGLMCLELVVDSAGDVSECVGGESNNSHETWEMVECK